MSGKDRARTWKRLVLVCSIWAGWWGACCLICGCGGATYQSGPVDHDVALDTLETVMESWKSGQPIKELAEEKPPIVVQDLDWQNGLALLKYEVLGDGKRVNANLYAQVKLSLKDKEGTESEKTVTYVVTTAPALTVFRDMLK